MPIYEYECLNCGKRTEVLQRMGEGPIAACPACGGEVKKLISSPSFQFKGTGWYVTDYAGKKGAGDSKSGDKSEGKSEGKLDDKPEGKAEKVEKADKADKADKSEKASSSESKGSGGSSGSSGGSGSSSGSGGSE
jgi:putative FmdB family regulatory protein